MGFRIDIRIDSHGNRGDFVQRCSHFLDSIEFRDAFDIKAVNFVFQSKCDFFSGLTNAGVNHFMRVAPGSQDTSQLATGNDVEAGTSLG